MAEYIEREALVKRLKKEECDCEWLWAILDIPTADVAPVRHAKWELIDECINEGVYCSNCHKKIYRARAEYANQKVKSNYCPNCGAKMDGDPYA